MRRRSFLSLLLGLPVVSRQDSAALGSASHDITLKLTYRVVYDLLLWNAIGEDDQNRRATNNGWLADTVIKERVAWLKGELAPVIAEYHEVRRHAGTCPRKPARNSPCPLCVAQYLNFILPG